MVDEWFGDGEAGAMNSTTASAVEATLASHLPGVLNATSPEEGTALARILRETLTGVMRLAGDPRDPS
jgi:hypothetical protein